MRGIGLAAVALDGIATEAPLLTGSAVEPYRVAHGLGPCLDAILRGFRLGFIRVKTMFQSIPHAPCDSCIA